MRLLFQILLVLFVLLLPLHFMVYRKYVGIFGAMIQLFVLPLIPVFIWRHCRSMDIGKRDKRYLVCEAYIISIMCILVVIYVSVSAVVLAFPKTPEIYRESLPAYKIIVRVDGSFLAASDRQAVDSVERVIKRPTLLMPILQKFINGSDVEYDVHRLYRQYRDAMFLSAGQDNGVYYVQLTDQDLPYVANIMPEILRRLDVDTRDGSAMILTEDGMKPFLVTCGGGRGQPSN